MQIKCSAVMCFFLFIIVFICFCFYFSYGFVDCAQFHLKLLFAKTFQYKQIDISFYYLLKEEKKNNVQNMCGAEDFSFGKMVEIRICSMKSVRMFVIQMFQCCLINLICFKNKHAIETESQQWLKRKRWRIFFSCFFYKYDRKTQYLFPEWF